jgi:hypothetical protein
MGGSSRAARVAFDHREPVARADACCRPRHITTCTDAITVLEAIERRHSLHRIPLCSISSRGGRKRVFRVQLAGLEEPNSSAHIEQRSVSPNAA